MPEHSERQSSELLDLAPVRSLAETSLRVQELVHLANVLPTRRTLALTVEIVERRISCLSQSLHVTVERLEEGIGIRRSELPDLLHPGELPDSSGISLKLRLVIVIFRVLIHIIRCERIGICPIKPALVGHWVEQGVPLGEALVVHSRQVRSHQLVNSELWAVRVEVVWSTVRTVCAEVENRNLTEGVRKNGRITVLVVQLPLLLRILPLGRLPLVHPTLNAIRVVQVSADDKIRAFAFRPGTNGVCLLLRVLRVVENPGSHRVERQNVYCHNRLT